MADSTSILGRFRRWLIWGVALAVVLYVGGSIWVGVREVGDELSHFNWWLTVPILLLTLVNYGLRFGKWHFFIRHLGIRVDWKENLQWFTAGLAMVISPGKAGELLKPYFVRERTGVPMATTVPALVAERLTDGIAILILAAFSVTTFAADKVHYIIIPAVLVGGGLAVLASDDLTNAMLRVLKWLPGTRRVSAKLEELTRALRTCLSPLPLLLTVVVSVVAWWAECAGYWLVFRGLDLHVGMDVCVFLYSFATTAGGAMPGGLGVADGALGGGAMQLIPEITRAQAIASALLVRIATLWFGVGIGAIALFRVGREVPPTALLDPTQKNGLAPLNPEET